MSPQGLLCPSAPLYEGARLLGVVNQTGTVDLLTTPLELDDDFIFAALQGRSPEKRFRFVHKCVKSACEKWDGHACGVAKTVLEKIEPQDWISTLPECGIRSQCRWYVQEGENACRVCPLVRYAY
ncbi:MAG: hypothetical protein RLZZ628_3451 [Bacteroidota bacterium]|jgi:hypothetical protein